MVAPVKGQPCLTCNGRYITLLNRQTTRTRPIIPRTLCPLRHHPPGSARTECPLHSPHRTGRGGPFVTFHPPRPACYTDLVTHPPRQGRRSERATSKQEPARLRVIGGRVLLYWTAGRARPVKHPVPGEFQPSNRPPCHIITHPLPLLCYPDRCPHDKRGAGTGACAPAARRTE